MNGEQTILLISNLFAAGDTYGGICKELALHLSEDGWQVIATSAVDNRWIRPFDMLKTIWRTRKYYSIVQIDVFSGSAFLWAEAVCLVLSLLKKPYVLTLRGGKLPQFAKRWPGRVKRLLASAAAVTTPSRYLQGVFADMREDILLLRNAVDLSRYPYQLRSQPNTQLAWLRAFHKNYNPQLPIMALGLLLPEFSDIKLTMFGPDKGDGTLQATQRCVDQLALMTHVHFGGPIPKTDVPRELAPSDIFLNSTTAESFGVSVVEAAALGMCIVTTNVGELPYIWTHDYDALLVPPNDPQAMADAIRRVLTEPGLAEKLSRNARINAEQFDWSVVLPQWKSLLTGVIEIQKNG